MKIWAKTAEFSEGKYLVVRRDGTIPEWPHFVIGGFDPNGPAGLRAYADQAEASGLDADYAASIRELASDFERLSATPRAVAIADPDAPPHRHDNPAVIAMMRGQGDVAQLQAELTRLQSLVDEAAGVLGALRQAARPFDLLGANLPQTWKPHLPLKAQSNIPGNMPTVQQYRDIAACTQDAASFLTRLRAQPNTTKPAMGCEPEGEG